MKYKVGDRVLIVDHRVDGMNQVGYMDRYLNTVMTIRTIRSGLFPYKMREDYYDPNCVDIGWVWNDDMIVGKVVDDNVVIKCS